MDRRPCPYCAELILENAIVCRFCGRDLQSGAVTVGPLTPKVPVDRVAATTAPPLLPPVSAAGSSRSLVGLGIVSILVGLAVAFTIGTEGLPVTFLCLWFGFALVVTGSVVLRVGGGFLVACLALVFLGATLPRVPGWAGSPSSSFLAPMRSPVTMAAFLRLQEGMSYAEASRILGGPGEEISRSDLAGMTTVMYQWRSDGIANMNAMFQDDKLITKAQMGLR